MKCTPSVGQPDGGGGDPLHEKRFAVGYGAAHGALAMTTSGDMAKVTFAALLDAIE